MALRGVLNTLVGIARGDAHARYHLADRLARAIHPDAVLSECDRYWLHDQEFRDVYTRFDAKNLQRMDRVFLLRELVKVAAKLPGDTAECGTYKGLSSYVICSVTAGRDRPHHVFDSFAGLSEPAAVDGGHWTKHDLSASERELRSNLAPFEFVEYHAGWIPERFGDVEDRSFSLVHIDVDLYAPTRDSVEFFRPRMVPGGIIVFDDYGSERCPGAREAIDEHARATGDAIVDSPTGQGLLFCPVG